MIREEAVKILNENLNNKNMVKHCLASGAVMKELARRVLENPLEEEVLSWELAGLLHDADAEATTPEDQGAMVGRWFQSGGRYEGLLPQPKTKQILPESFEEQIIHTMAAHNEMTGVPCESPMDYALYAGEKLTGLIVATALVLPSKKLSDVTAEIVMRRFKEKSFAKGAKRENIMQGTKLGLSLEEFVALGLKAMQSVAADLGL